MRKAALGRRRLPSWARYTVVCLALSVAYAAVPVREEPDPVVLALRWALTVAMLAAIAIAIRWQALRQLREPDAPFGGLVVGILAGLLVFALIDYVVAAHRPGEFSGL